MIEKQEAGPPEREKRDGRTRRSKRMTTEVLRRLTLRQWLTVVVLGGMMAVGLAVLCYRRLWLAGVVWLPATLVLAAFRGRQKQQLLRRQERADFHFLLRQLRANVIRGLSLANALVMIPEAEFPAGKIKTDWLHIRRDMRLGQSLDQCLTHFAQGLKDIDQRFCCEVLLLTGHHGGSLQQVLQDGLQVMEERIATEAAIERAIAAKQYEFRVMEMMPLLLLIYVELTNPTTYEQFLQGPIGIWTMTAVILIYTLIVWKVEQKLLITV